VSGAIGVRATLIGAGVLGAVVTFSALFIRGVRSVEGRPVKPVVPAGRIGESQAVVASTRS
jgi:hypothetical protein